MFALNVKAKGKLTKKKYIKLIMYKPNLVENNLVKGTNFKHSC